MGPKPALLMGKLKIGPVLWWKLKEGVLVGELGGVPLNWP
jgi:hypothetical protein